MYICNTLATACSPVWCMRACLLRMECVIVYHAVLKLNAENECSLNKQITSTYFVRVADIHFAFDSQKHATNLHFLNIFFQTLKNSNVVNDLVGAECASSGIQHWIQSCLVSCSNTLSFESANPVLDSKAILKDLMKKRSCTKIHPSIDANKVQPTDYQFSSQFYMFLLCNKKLSNAKKLSMFFFKSESACLTSSSHNLHGQFCMLSQKH